ncbi:MAG TPA: ATP synthase F0 subunit B [Candidatus Acidoferrum sp.]|nr:ATP synthase F0 subunit B [Candidatus Acidoferrum sp.]
MTRVARLVGCAGLFLLLAAEPALAQEGGPSPADTPTGWVFRWINFAIVLGLIVYALRKAAPYFRNHADEISQKIAEGTRAREAAEKQRREAQARLAGIETEVAALRVEAKKSAEAETERLRELARVEAEMIERAAQAEIAASERAARLELKAAAARMATERAEALLRTQLTPQAEATLFGSFVAQLEGKVN